VTSRFIAAMERILWLYALPYDPDYPVICFDERPCFLIEDRLEPIAMAPRQPGKEHYAYKKNGSCALLAAIEPLTGQRLAHVRERRTKKEFTLFCQALAQAYPEAVKIRLVLDNLNTHSPASFYDWLPADQAFDLAQRFEFYYTPKGASWLNMIEIEFSALSRLCLNRRIPTIQLLERQVVAFFNDRCAKQIKINWLFSVDDCRDKLNAKYAAVNCANSKSRKT
jgi:hypothetical protein